MEEYDWSASLNDGLSPRDRDGNGEGERMQEEKPVR